MELKGLKINFLGDSITQGVGTSAPEHMFWKVVEAKTGAICRGYGLSGTRIARQYNPTTYNPSFDLDFCMRAKEMDKDADLIVVFGGTNDFGHGDAPFGKFEDRTKDTFYGAVHELCTTLINLYPESEIVFITPLHRSDENMRMSTYKPLLKEYIDAMREILEYYSIPVLDLYSSGKIQPSVEILKNLYMPDGLHPSDKGNEIIANRLINFIKTL